MLKGGKEFTYTQTQLQLEFLFALKKRMFKLWEGFLVNNGLEPKSLGPSNCL